MLYMIENNGLLEVVGDNRNYLDPVHITNSGYLDVVPINELSNGKLVGVIENQIKCKSVVYSQKLDRGLNSRI